MVLSPDQDRVRAMLKETITLLCRNGLKFQKKFCIDAVIGVTLDDSDVFLVSMNEIVTSGLHPPASPDCESNSEAGEERESKRKQRKRHKRKSVDSNAAESDNTDLEDSYSVETEQKQPFKINKLEEDNTEDEDLVFVKQEPTEQWFQSETQTDHSSVSQLQPEESFNMSDMNLASMSERFTQASGSRLNSVMSNTLQNARNISWDSPLSQSDGPLEFVAECDDRNYDSGLRYRWHWEWLDMFAEGHPNMRGCIRKITVPGMAYCVVCSRMISYKNNGSRLLREHVQSKKHKMACPFSGNFHHAATKAMPRLSQNIPSPNISQNFHGSKSYRRQGGAVEGVDTGNTSMQNTSVDSPELH